MRGKKRPSERGKNRIHMMSKQDGGTGGGQRTQKEWGKGAGEEVEEGS